MRSLCDFSHAFIKILLKKGSRIKGYVGEGPKAKETKCSGWPHERKVKPLGDRSVDTSKLVSIEVPKMNVKNPRLKVRKPVFTLIRADTTLDLSQKAEKV